MVKEMADELVPRIEDAPCLASTGLSLVIKLSRGYLWLLPGAEWPEYVLFGIVGQVFRGAGQPQG